MMPNGDLPVLKNHPLTHLRELRVARSIFEGTFARDCSMLNCNATCCKGGVMVDVEEQNNIVAHAETIKKYMEPRQEKDHTRWFDEKGEVDLDFPSGRAIGTQVRDYGCVFLDSVGRCVLQTAAMEEGMSKFALKPFFCFAYPITIEDGVLMVDDPEFTNRPQCCSSVANGEQSVIDACAEEIKHVLGPQGWKELCESVEQRNVTSVGR